MCPSAILSLTNSVCNMLRLRRGVRIGDVASNRLSTMKSELAVDAVIRHVDMRYELTF